MWSEKYTYSLILFLLSGILTMLLMMYGNSAFTEIPPVKATGAAIIVFTLIELFSIWMLESKNEKQSPRQSVNILLGLKVGKMMIALIFIAVYAIAIRVEMNRFIIVFMGLYFIYLIFNTLYLTHREKRLKATAKT
ncbi:MAG: hypothetical protein LBE56_09495 [Tannerella sp.]|jgi:L-asparagine transporter-like permease|nr:hypothetical protein [Tannerella sp.]